MSTPFDETRAAPIYRAVSPNDVAWIDDAAPPLAARCTVCGDPGPHRRLRVVPSLAPPNTALTLSRCAGCGSGFYDPPGITDFSDLNQDRDDFWRFYVEVGGGVWERIWPLFVNAILREGMGQPFGDGALRQLALTGTLALTADAASPRLC